LKILLADKQKHCVLNRNDRCWIIASVEHRQLGDRTSGTFDAEYLFSVPWRALQCPNTARLDHKQARTRLSFTEHDLSG
jgi:hypothetical protein